MNDGQADLGAEIAAVFDRAAPHYDQALPLFHDLAAELVAWHPPRRGERVLDLCTGGGACLCALTATSHAGRLLGIDLSGGMLARARKSLPGGVLVLQADAHRLPFADGSFDSYYCALSWQFLMRPELVLAELRRTGHKRAGLTFSLLGRSRHTGHFMNKVLLDFLGPRQPRFASALQALWRRPAEVTLAAAGWRVRARGEITRRYDFGGARQWLTWQLSQVGRGFFDLVPDDRKAGFYARLLEEAERTCVTDGLWLEQTVTLLHAEPAR
ncbi:class I SAM-dependent methyltransferase [Spongiactinospora sp. 9N601]|uniref:class I SAM-dependent methyltransferase n=1 Tax=Spongiactinospora sp. 9N601 TaxID=3375149 RepID=UPI0037A2A3A3